SIEQCPNDGFRRCFTGQLIEIALYNNRGLFFGHDEQPQNEAIHKARFYRGNCPVATLSSAAKTSRKRNPNMSTIRTNLSSSVKRVRTLNKEIAMSLQIVE